MNTKGMKVGDVAYSSHGKYGEIDVRKGVVTKVTPTGHVTVDYGNYSDRYLPNGWVVGGGAWVSDYLIDEVAYLLLSAEADAIKLRAAIRDYATTSFSGIASKADALASVGKLRAMIAALPDDA